MNRERSELYRILSPESAHLVFTSWPRCARARNPDTRRGEREDMSEIFRARTELHEAGQSIAVGARRSSGASRLQPALAPGWPWRTSLGSAAALNLLEGSGPRRRTCAPAHRQRETTHPAGSGSSDGLEFAAQRGLEVVAANRVGCQQLITGVLQCEHFPVTTRQPVPSLLVWH